MKDGSGIDKGLCRDEDGGRNEKWGLGGEGWGRREGLLKDQGLHMY